MLTAKHLTNGERLFVSRRRLAFTKADFAAEHGVSLYRYSRWESDLEEGPGAKTGKLAFCEVSVLLRRRAGVSAADFAWQLDCSPWWLRQMESGEVSDKLLRDFWELPEGRRIIGEFAGATVASKG